MNCSKWLGPVVPAAREADTGRIWMHPGQPSKTSYLNNKANTYLLAAVTIISTAGFRLLRPPGVYSLGGDLTSWEVTSPLGLMKYHEHEFLR